MTSYITVITDVTPSRMFTTSTPTVSVTSTPTVPLIPEVNKLDDDELPTGAIIGITVGAVVVLFIIVLTVIVIAKR